jgi:hypothetical protein
MKPGDRVKHKDGRVGTIVAVVPEDDERLRGPCEECCATDVLTTCTACTRDLCSECFTTLGCCDRCTADMP